MNIQEVKSGSHDLNHLRNDSVDAPDNVDSPAESAPVEGGQTGRDEDSVEISADAGATASEAPPSEEMQMLRDALHSTPSLSAERRAEIHRRIKEGYYSTPEVMKEIAERLGEELGGNPDKDE